MTRGFGVSLWEHFNAFYIFKMHFAAALVFLCLSVFPVLLKGTTTCQSGNQKDHIAKKCPVEMTSSVVAGNTYSECVSVRVRIKYEDFCKIRKLRITSPINKTLWPTLVKCPKKIQCDKKKHRGEKVICISCNNPQLLERNTSHLLWDLVHDCVEAKTGQNVSVFYGTKSVNCSVTYRVEGKPDFDLSVNSSNKSISVTMKKKSIDVTTKTENTVSVRHCYQNQLQCMDKGKTAPLTIDMFQSAVLSIPYLLPCVCIEAYYAHYHDAERRKKCPFENTGVMDARDVFSSSEIEFYTGSFQLSTLCPASQLNISASLCWMQRANVCTPVLNSSLKKKNGAEYDISTVDKHPQMCVQLSIQGTPNISCPFKSDDSSWEVYIGPGKQSIIVYLDSSSPAAFSTQLCVLTESGCTALGKEHSLTMEGNASEKRIKVPLHFPAEKPCVQVWQSDPARHGKRILCPDYTHNRSGMYAVAVLVFVFIVGSLGIFIHRATKRGAAGWLYIQRPLLLVCSSDQSEHISAVCALASILQEELGAVVRTALWAQSSQSQDGSGPGVADLGPLPWLYGQWDAVCREQGKVLVIWSPEAKKTFEKRRQERASMDKSERKEENDRNADVKHEKTKTELEEDLKQNGSRLEKSQKEKAAGKKDDVKLCDGKNWYQQKETSTVIEPMFTAVLARLERVLQECKNQGVVLVYFQGLGHSRDIPKAFSDVHRYCLPQDFRGLIGELGEVRRRTETKNFRWDCWSRVLSKVLAIWLAQKLTHRLHTLVPQTQGNKVQSKMPSMKMTSDKPESSLK